MRSVAILTGPSTYLDHLGVLSTWLRIPLIVTDEAVFETAKTYYPYIDVEFKELSDLSIDYLTQHYDVIFETGKFWAIELAPFMELLHKKKMRFVFCPHGNSDKGHSLQTHVQQDISLVYGDHLVDHLKTTGAHAKINHLIPTGNYRLPFYLRHRAFYDELADRLIFSRLTQGGIAKPIILYAPTWQDRENPTSFFSAMETFIDDLSQDYHVIVKLHPFLLEDSLTKVLPLLYRYENHPSILFLTDFPPIYPLLARCDLYLGDFSSIGYDFLAFDRPLYFLNPHRDNPSPLQKCGLKIPNTSAGGARRFLLETYERSKQDLSALRQSTYRYAFGNGREMDQIKEEIFRTIRATAVRPSHFGI